MRKISIKMNKRPVQSFNVRAKSKNSNRSFYEKDIKSEDISFDNSTLSENKSQFRKSYSNPYLDYIANATSTSVVTNIKVFAGIMDVFENINDGVLWTRGKIVEGSSYVNAKLAGLINDEWEKQLLLERENDKRRLREHIAVNIVDNIEDSFFTSEIGRSINDRSYLKYNSATANMIENVSKVGTEIVAATAATIATGGTASPIMIAAVGGTGFLEGAGESAENIYQESENSSLREEARIFLSGLESGTTWYAYGRAGSGVINVAGEIRSAVTNLPNATIKDVSESLRTLLRTRRRGRTKRYMERSFRDAFLEPDSIVDTFNGIFETVNENLSGELNSRETMAKTSVGILQNIAVNTLVNRFGYLGQSLRAVDSYSLDGRVASIAIESIKMLDAFEDSGLVDVNIYDIGKNIFNEEGE